MLATLAAVFLCWLGAGCATANSAAPPTGAQPNHAPAVATAPGQAPVSLSETGSTLLFPLLRMWASAYHQQFSQVTIATAGTGSGAGIKAASDGTADIGASDAFLSSGNLVTHPDLLNIPLAISAQQVNYNVPGMRPGVHIRLNGAVLAGMYQGRVRTWNSPAITALNPGVNLPATKVVPLHRAESSGETFLFSSYLATNVPGWNRSIGYGTTVAWPAAPSALAEQGNSGMVA